jgi:AcrR family transcriptional regulator
VELVMSRTALTPSGLAGPTVPPTSRGRATRQRILRATAELLATRGVHSLGVDEIGAAAGVSGPAIYRHFASKTDVIVAVFDTAIDGLNDNVQRVAELGADPADALRGLIRSHVDFALRERAVLAIYFQEVDRLPTADRRRLRRKQRQYVETWRTLLRRHAPQLRQEEALVRVEAVFGLLNSVAALSTSVPDAVVRREYALLAWTALTAGETDRLVS